MRSEVGGSLGRRCLLYGLIWFGIFWFLIPCPHFFKMVVAFLDRDCANGGLVALGTALEQEA